MVRKQKAQLCICFVSSVKGKELQWDRAEPTWLGGEPKPKTREIAERAPVSAECIPVFREGVFLGSSRSGPDTAWCWTRLDLPELDPHNQDQTPGPITYPVVRLLTTIFSISTSIFNPHNLDLCITSEDIDALSFIFLGTEYVLGDIMLVALCFQNGWPSVEIITFSTS